MNKIQIDANAGPKAIGPYSTGIQAGQFIYLSGQLPMNEDGSLVEDDISAQTKKAIENIEAILKEQGLGLEHVLKTTVFLSDFNDFQKMNQLYAIYFTHPYPARTCVEVSFLPKGARIEIECIVLAEQENVQSSYMGHCYECDE